MIFFITANVVYFHVIYLFLKMVSFCCICRLTKGEIKHVTFHTVPKNKVRRQKWVTVLGQEVKKTSAVCSRHFQKCDFKYQVYNDEIKKTLLPDAVPSLLLERTSGRVSYNMEMESMQNMIEDDILNLNSNVKVNEDVISENQIDEAITDIHYNSCIKTESTIDNLDENQVGETIIYKYEIINNEIKKTVVTESIPSLLSYKTSESESNNYELQNVLNTIDPCSNVTNLASNMKVNHVTTNENQVDEMVKKSHSNSSDDGESTSDSLDKNQVSEAVEACLKSNDPSLFQSKNSKYIRYVEDLRRHDFTSDKAYEIFKIYVHTSKKKIRGNNKALERMHIRVECVKELLLNLKKTGLITEEGFNIIKERSHIFNK